MKTIIVLLFVFLSTCLGIAPSVPAETLPPLRVLIVSGGENSGAGGFKDLLEKHGIATEVVPWKEASADKARAFDLVMIVGQGRRIRSTDLVLDYDRPVLGVGPYGCMYFGRLKLKNGHPYT
jgi:hypothetical protein